MAKKTASMLMASGIDAEKSSIDAEADWHRCYGRVRRAWLEALALTVRESKWKHDRTTMLPATVTADLHEQIVHARLVHQEDLPTGRHRAQSSLGAAGTPGGTGCSRHPGAGVPGKAERAGITCTRPSCSAP